MVLLINRPPYSEEQPVTVGTFLDEFPDFISQYVNTHPNLIIMGGCKHTQ